VKLILDADVLIGALDGSDAHHSRARDLFTTWHREQTTRLISVINLSEVLIAPASDRKRLRRARTAIAALGVAIHQPNEAIGVDAARLRSVHPISLPDAYCLATARHVNGSIASFDQKIIRAAQEERLTLAVAPEVERAP
jgi:predicted nucleic acid-binding protein